MLYSSVLKYYIDEPPQMEDIYLGLSGKKEWCSEKVQLDSYFENYSQQLSFLNIKQISESEILQCLVPEHNLKEQDLLSLKHITNGSQLTKLRGDDMLNFNTSFQDSCGTSELTDKYRETEDVNSLTHKPKVKNRLKNDKKQKIREITLDSADQLGPKNLCPQKDFVVTFRIHSPFPYIVGENVKPTRCIQQIDVLANQKLTKLRDKIICESDFQDVRGNVSDHPDLPIKTTAKDMYESNMFYFDNTFYIDTRKKYNKDYSIPIKKWAHGRNIPLGETLPMEDCSIGELKLRFGYPYLYVHQGSCEHLIIVSDSRFISINDSLCSQDYPLTTKVYNGNTIHCMSCYRFPARWIVRDCDRLAHDPTFHCDKCFKLFHYVKDKKIDNKFKAYQIWQRNIII